MANLARERKIMLVKIRENIFLGDAKVKASEIKKNKIGVIVFVADEHIKIDKLSKEVETFSISLHSDTINKPYIKDIACHIPKYMTENGETVAVIGKTGMRGAAFVVARAICEIEAKAIYEILMEMVPMIGEGFKIGKAYL